MKNITFIIIVILLTIALENTTYADMNYVMDINGIDRIPIPAAYEVTGFIQYIQDDISYMRNPQDIFVNKNNMVYVADTMNNRVLMFNEELDLIRVYPGPDNGLLKRPEGIFADDYGNLIVADTGNFRILHLSPEGDFIEEFQKPESDLLEGINFTPSKVSISPIGNLYVLRHHSLMIIDGYGEFRGFFGSLRVNYTLYDVLVRMFATREQKERIANLTPSSYIAFTIDQYGMIYATTTEDGQIRKFNSIGTNIYQAKFYGERFNDEGTPIKPYFSDISVDSYGIVTVIERNTNKIYQYDQEGNLLAVFGGTGNWKGTFASAASLAVDSKGKIYILDSVYNIIQVLKPTRFMNLIHEALQYYYDGKYNEAEILWEEVLRIHASYPMARRGIAHAQIKQGRYREAMENYRLVDDMEGYSEAFAYLRHDIYRRYFVVIILILFLSVLLVRYIVKHTRRIAGNFLDI